MNQEEFREIMDNEVQGAENAVKKMLLYYVSALISTGVEDVKQYIATQISKMIDLSEEQYYFIVSNFNKDNRIVENINNSVQLLKKIEDKEELDLDSIKIVRQLLELILQDYEESIKNV